MELKLFNEKSINFDFINNFIKELKNCMEENKFNLTSEEQRLYSREEFKVYESLEDNYYVVHKKYYEGDRIKLEQCKNNQSKLIIIHSEDIENSDIKQGDILKKEGNKYILDEQKTNQIKQELFNIKKQIVENRENM